MESRSCPVLNWAGSKKETNLHRLHIWRFESPWMMNPIFMGFPNPSFWTKHLRGFDAVCSYFAFNRAVLGDIRYSKECENGAVSSKAKLENRLDYTWISSWAVLPNFENRHWFTTSKSWHPEKSEVVPWKKSYTSTRKHNRSAKKLPSMILLLLLCGLWSSPHYSRPLLSVGVAAWEG